MGFGNRGIPPSSVWIHGASIGEVRASFVIIDKISKTSEKTHILVTFQTFGAEETLKKHIRESGLEKRVSIRMVPIDVPLCVGAFLRATRPVAAIFIESEFWPALLLGLKRYKIPAVLVNGNLSNKSFEAWRMAGDALSILCSVFKACFVSSESAFEKISSIAGAEVFRSPSIKCAANRLSASAELVSALRESIAERQFLLATCIHAEEEALVLDSFKRLRETMPKLILIIAPRHIERAHIICEMCSKIGLKSVLRSTVGFSIGESDVYVIDTFGELGIFYEVANFALLGGSFSSAEGHNILEPAMMRCAVVQGNRIKSQEEISDEFISEGACVCCGSYEMLSLELLRLLQNPYIASSMAEKSFVIAERLHKNSQKLANEIMDILNVS
ncbi:3-deoxy-D-manno-octulosonic acid transferase [Candidatus Hydrogenosomobacter endosymbioticus]|uniref:3-deoxy-D-manno-octulosonic acid transferase n=2 Tax=Candidatus Hydrogenosomobacter endosymbioticus TaxID=2558174 RepID=A0ABM7VAJ9_9PROT|nr:3-deoxy-D-manno-octulosonic acid transferase [Candidatus Hydrogenosomobacter endosymbioticus]